MKSPAKVWCEKSLGNLTVKPMLALISCACLCICVNVNVYLHMYVRTYTHTMVLMKWANSIFLPTHFSPPFHRYSLLPVMKGFPSLHPWGSCLKSVTWRLPLQPQCLEQGSCLPTPQTWDGTREGRGEGREGKGSEGKAAAFWRLM